MPDPRRGMCQFCQFYKPLSSNKGQCREDSPVPFIGWPRVSSSEWCGRYEEASWWKDGPDHIQAEKDIDQELEDAAAEDEDEDDDDLLAG